MKPQRLIWSANKSLRSLGICSFPASTQKTMVGLMLLFLVSVTISRADDTALRDQIDQLSSQLLSLQERAQEKDLCILELDDVISDLQRQLQGVKVAGLDSMLKRNQEDLFNLQCKTQSLLLDIDRLGSESQHLEIISASQMKQLDEAERALHIVEESIKQAQAQVDEKNRIISKGYTQWLPYWMETNFAHWQGTWISTLEEAWKRAVSLAVCGSKNYHKSKFLKHLDALVLQIWTYKQRAQKVVEEEVHAAWELCESFLSRPVKTLGLHLNQPNSILQPYLSQLSLYFSKGLKYGINRHLQLQRKIRKLLQRNDFLASKESREVVWFLASALLILPLYGVLLLSSFLGKRRRPLVARRYRRGQGVHWRHEQRQPLVL
ncbi:hypothetical protein GOP47_0027367 [Adiantum capillus-veneris]|nr:hypothetical protein GOP47_0027367 [Adiantum capillus-veneris]